jgi:hypothetical protein
MPSASSVWEKEGMEHGGDFAKPWVVLVFVAFVVVAFNDGASTTYHSLLIDLVSDELEEDETEKKAAAAVTEAMKKRVQDPPSTASGRAAVARANMSMVQR